MVASRASAIASLFAVRRIDLASQDGCEIATDGSVEARLRGTTEGVEAVIADMRRGPRFAEVATLRIEVRPRNEDAWLGFEVRRTV